MPSNSFTTALLAEGSTDCILIPILAWLLEEHAPDSVVFNPPTLIEPALLQGTPKRLLERIPKAIEIQPCDLLFVHRDGDIEGDLSPRDAYARRAQEITAAYQVSQYPPVVCVIPVQETEAWYLLNEDILRRVVGNPRGNAPLGLPRSARVEDKRDAKGNLHTALIAAATTRDKKLVEKRITHYVKQLEYERMDYSLLRELPAFQNLEMELRTIVAQFFPH